MNHIRNNMMSGAYHDVRIEPRPVAVLKGAGESAKRPSCRRWRGKWSRWLRLADAVGSCWLLQTTHLPIGMAAMETPVKDQSSPPVRGVFAFLWTRLAVIFTLSSFP